MTLDVCRIMLTLPASTTRKGRQLAKKDRIEFEEWIEKKIILEIEVSHSILIGEVKT